MLAAYRTVLLPLYGQNDETGAVAFAAGLARTMPAHVGALYLSRVFEALPKERQEEIAAAYRERGWTAAMSYLDALYRSDSGRDAGEFRNTVAKHFAELQVRPSPAEDAPLDAASFSWKQNLDLGADIGRLLVRRAIAADIAVASGAALGADAQEELLGAVVMEAGRPLIVVPPGWAGPVAVPEHAAIAWKETVNAVRAVTAAMPLLVRARHVTLIEIEEDRRPAPDRVAAAQMAALLGRHGVRTNVVTRDAGRVPAVTILDEEIARLGAGLLVMGAYSRARLREIVFGGFTEHVLDTLKVPVLFAH